MYSYLIKNLNIEFQLLSYPVNTPLDILSNNKVKCFLNLPISSNLCKLI
jgi:hypothetical protein